MQLLTLDCQHAEITGTWTLYNCTHGLNFMFDTADEVREFVSNWYNNRIGTEFAYHQKRWVPSVWVGMDWGREACVPRNAGINIRRIWDIAP